MLLQKPMANTLAEARAIVDAADRAGVTLAVNQNGRWDPAIQACRALLDRGVFGQLITASIEMRTRQPWQEYWKDDANYPRLMLLGMSIHHLDQFRFLFGEPLEITAHLATYPGQPWAGDSIALYVLRYESGLLATGFDDGFPWTRDWSERLPHRGARGHRPRSHRLDRRELQHARVHHDPRHPTPGSARPSRASGSRMPSRPRWVSSSWRSRRIASPRSPAVTTCIRSASSRPATTRPRSDARFASTSSSCSSTRQSAPVLYRSDERLCPRRRLRA